MTCQVPTQSITMGIENIMEAEKILLIARKNKAEAIYQTVKEKSVLIGGINLTKTSGCNCCC